MTNSLFYKITISLTVVFACLQGTTAAQSKYIHGTIKSRQDNEGVSAMVIVIDSANKVISYTQSDKDGHYKIARPPSPGDFWVEVNIYGFQKAREPILQDKETYNFVLELSPIMLEEVKIGVRPVIQNGDTLSFNVQSFSQKQDRTIGDVLQRLPGIGVGEDGSISYNGKKIENLYIHGDDLMGGRYGMATKTIQKELIVSINIINNHQPVKALRNKVHTDKIAVDLVLKDENNLKASGNIRVGAGMRGLYDVEVSQVALNKKYKMLNAVGANNTGISYEDQLKSIGASSFTGSISGMISQIPLSLGGAGKPNLPPIYYLKNQSVFTSINNLITLKNEVQLRINVAGLNDNNTFRSSSAITNFLQEDTLRFIDSQLLESKPKMREATFNLMANKSKYYLNNNTKLGWLANYDYGQMDFNDQTFDQHFNKRVRNISNDFTFIPTYKKNSLLEIRWLLENNTDHKSLDIGLGYRPTFSQNDSGVVWQRVNLPTFISNSFFSYTHASAAITQQYKFGFMSEKQKLNSGLHSDNGEPLIPASDNSLTWSRSYPYVSALYQIKTGKARYEVTLPLEYQTVLFKDSNESLNDKNHNLLFSPKLRINIEFTPEKTFRTEYGFNRTLGDISQIYPNAILLDFRSLTANDPILQTKNNHYASAEYRYEKSIAMLLMYGKTSYAIQNSNTMQAWQFEENIQRSKTLLLENRQKTLSVAGGISKFFWSPKFRLSLDGAFSSMNLEQLINNSLTPIASQNYNVKGKFEKKIFNSISAEYLFSASLNTNASQRNQDIIQFKNSFTSLNHRAAIVFNTGKQWQAKLSGIKSRATQPGNNPIQYFFLDLNMNYRTQSKKMELVMDISNIFNQKRFEIYNFNANQAISKSYELRGRTSLLKVIYYF